MTRAWYNENAPYPAQWLRLLASRIPQRVAKLRALGNAIDLRPATAWVQAVHESLTQ